MDHKTVEDYILSLPNVRLDYPFGDGVAVYKVGVAHGAADGADQTTGKGDEKMFALVAEGKDPVNLSLKCDPGLATVLREKYVTVMPGYHLNKKHWNTVILSGEMPWDEVQDLIRHSYQLVSGTQL